MTAVFLGGLVCNYLGKLIIDHTGGPLWLDSFGTCFVASVLGPVWGALCGISLNVLYGLLDPQAFAYMLVSMAIGLIVGFGAKRGFMDKWFRAMLLSVLVSLVSAVISVCLNFWLNQGYPSNDWGDGLYDMLDHFHFPIVLCAFFGELFIDFADKAITVMAIFGILHIPKVKELRQLFGKTLPISAKAVVSLGLAVLLSAGVLLPGSDALAAPSGEEATQEADAQTPISDQETTQETSVLAAYSPTVYNTASGLVGGASNDIVETPEGYLWIGTYAGLYCYDGTDFTHMDQLDSVKNVNCLFVDDAGRMWIGTNDNGVTVYSQDGTTEVINDGNGLSSDSIRCIRQDPLGNYYVGTSESLYILSYDADDQAYVKNVLSDISYTNHISVADNGQVAVVSNAGELYILEDGQIIAEYISDDEDIYFTTCEYMEDGSLWLGSSGNQIYVMQGTGETMYQSQELLCDNLKNIHGILKDNHGNFWLASDNGIGYFDDQLRYRAFKLTNFNSSVYNIIMDYCGNLWFTSSRMGLLRLSESGFVDLYGQNGMAEVVVNSVVRWNGLLYSGTDDGLDIIDLENDQVIENDLTARLAGQRIRSLKVDSKNHLWICTVDGEGLLEVVSDQDIRIFNTQNGTIGNRFRTTLELSDGTIAVAENTGLDFIADDVVIRQIREADGLSTPLILSLLELSDGTLLAGSDGDGIAVIRDGQIVGKISEEEGLTSGVILRLVQGKHGVFVVTSNSICFMDTDTWAVRELDQFPYSNNYDMISADNGSFWVLSSAGIYVVEEDALEANEHITYELLDNKQGLEQPLTANARNYVDEDSNLYLSCNTGVYMVNIDQYEQYDYSFRVLLSYLKADDEIYSKNLDKVILPGKVERIVLKPVVLNYTLNDPYVSYYLEGFDRNTVTVKQSNLGEITYTNLSAGTYRLHIEVLDNSGENVLSSSVYTIVKQKEMWEKTWFLAFLIIICIVAVVFITVPLVLLSAEAKVEKIQYDAKMANETVMAIARTVDAKDVRTSRHSQRVADYSVQIARRLGWSQEECEKLYKIAQLHDIGKIGINDAVLNKTSNLTEEEYALMKSHVTIGAEILKGFTLVDHVADGALYHHERYDGKGYVHGLKGDEIPVTARIISVADAFDAMTSNRIYRHHLDMNEVVEELQQGSGTQFDPMYVQALIDLIKEGAIDVEANRRMDSSQKIDFDKKEEPDGSQ